MTQSSFLHSTAYKERNNMYQYVIFNLLCLAYISRTVVFTYTGFFFSIHTQGEGQGEPEYECGKRNLLYQVWATYSVSTVMYLTCIIIIL